MRVLGPLGIRVVGDPLHTGLAAPLLELAADGPVEGIVTIDLEFGGAAPLEARPGPHDFFVGSARGWIAPDGRIVLAGEPFELSIAPGRVEVALASGAAFTPSQRDDFALVELWCAVTLAARAAGWWHAHAAAVMLPGGSCVLVAGASGAGKSTTTIAALAGGANWMADDTVLLRSTEAGVVAAGIPRVFHVTDRTLAAFPGLGPAVQPGRRSLLGKACVDPRMAFQGRQVAVPMRPELLLLPRVAGDTTRLDRLDEADALGALIESSAWVTVDGLPGREDHLATLVELCRQVEVWEASVAPDILARPARLIELLQERLGA